MSDTIKKPLQTRPLTEGYSKKGGQNPATSKVSVRPPPPPKISTGSQSPPGKPPNRD